MNRLLASCLALLLVAQAVCALPAPLDYLLSDEEGNQIAKRYADDDAMYRVQRSRASCRINCIDCARTLTTSFMTDSCMKYCKTVEASDSNKYTTCHRFYIRD